MLHLTELEELLASEQGEQHKQQLLAQLQTERQQTNSTLIKGLTPDQYPLQQAKLQALDAAVDILVTQITHH